MSCTNAVALFECSCAGHNSTKYVQGVVKFHQCQMDKGTWVVIKLRNFEPHKTHAIHIHEFGDERKGCVSLGAHWNPEHTTHGSLFRPMPSHAGDMINNLRSDQNGRFEYEYLDPRISLRGDVDESIIGRSVVIHFGKDDYGLGGRDPYNAKVRAESLKTGNAGKRMACAIIGRAKDGPI